MAWRAIIDVPPSSQPTLANGTREWGTRLFKMCTVYRNGNWVGHPAHTEKSIFSQLPVPGFPNLIPAWIKVETNII